MDPEQRRRAGAAVGKAMDELGLSAQQLSDMSGVAPVTVRDLVNGKRWPWTSKRNAIEFALDWEPGTIAQIAKGQRPSPAGGDPAGALEELGVDEALRVLLERSPLSRARRARVMAFYLAELEEQERLDAGEQPRRASGV